MTVPLAGQIEAVEREIAMRKAVYAKRVASKAMKQEKADYEIAAMEAVLNSLRILQDYAKVKNWAFAHDEQGALLWISKLGPEPAQEVNNGTDK